MTPNDNLLRTKSKENVISPVRTPAMVIIYTSVESKNDCFVDQVVKN